MFSLGKPPTCEKCRSNITLSQYTLRTRLCGKCIEKIKREKEKFQKLLGLDNLVINIIPIYDAHSTSSMENGVRTIEYCYNHPEYELIHELGHFLLSEKTKYEKFVSPPPSKCNEEIFFYSNAILDDFADSNWVEIDNLYTYYMKYVKVILSGMKNIPTQATLRSILEGFLKFYISFNYIIRKDDKKKLQVELTNALEILKKYCINQSILIYKKTRLNTKIFKSIEAELSKFETVKDTSDNKIITKFMYNVLRLIPFLSENILKNEIKLIYP
ncbi:hypothetical protein LCGC14_2200480 [marine sediment metagenome]|uniref:Uncharacterized protein n=1 Tax=marine sediment metagenome TaxID=412755 RepID=A0A0F9DGW2_9ZZZZ